MPRPIPTGTAPARGGSEFRRDAPTTAAYAALLCFTFWNYGYGPALSLLRDELGFSYAVMGVYTATWSVGTVATGVLFPVMARHLSRRGLLLLSSATASAGSVAFVTGTDIVSTLAGAGVLALGGTTLLTVVQAVLSDRHGELRERALTEANIGAAASAVLAPLALGALAAGPLGWRAGLLLPALGLAALLLGTRRTPLPAPPPAVDSATPQHRRLPPAGRLFLGLIAGSMAVEFCLVYFGAEQLKVVGLSTPDASTAMSAHYAGLLLGRLSGAVATRRPGRGGLLLHASLATTGCGFLLFWLADRPVLAVVGLLVAGLGIANLYPLALALALGASPGQEDRANAGAQLLGGLLVIAAPSSLGALADVVGLRAAFAVEPVLIATCWLLLVGGLRTHRQDPPALTPRCRSFPDTPRQGGNQ